MLVLGASNILLYVVDIWPKWHDVDVELLAGTFPNSDDSLASVFPNIEVLFVETLFPKSEDSTALTFPKSEGLIKEGAPNNPPSFVDFWEEQIN